MYYAFLSADYYIRLIEENSNYYSIVYIVTLLISVLIGVVVTIFVYKILSKVEAERTKILGSFYKIPQYYVKWLSKKCRDFTNQMQKTTGNGEDSEDDENSIGAMDLTEIEKNYSSPHKTKRINPRDFQQGNKIYLVKIAFVASVFISYFLVSSVSNIVLLGDIKILNKLFNMTALAYPSYTIAYNLIREKIDNNNLTLFQNQDPIFLNNTLDGISDLNNQIISVSHLLFNYYRLMLRPVMCLTLLS